MVIQDIEKCALEKGELQLGNMQQQLGSNCAYKPGTKQMVAKLFQLQPWLGAVLIPCSAPSLYAHNC